MAPQEQPTKGIILARRKGRSGTAFDYAFVVDGREYKGHDYPTLSRNADSNDTLVYFYPDNPSVNSLTEFGEMSAIHNRVAIHFFFASIGVIVVWMMSYLVKMPAARNAD